MIANPPFNVDKVKLESAQTAGRLPFGLPGANAKTKDDACNYFTIVNRTLNEWTEWQLKNQNAIVWLYRGETKKIYCTIGRTSSADR